MNQLEVLAKARRPKRHTHSFEGVLRLTIPKTWAVTTQMEAAPPCSCGLTLGEYQSRQRRGRSSLRAGKDGERAIAKAYGGERVGQYGGAADVVIGEVLVIQSKVGWFSERFWAELQKLPRTGGRIPTLIVADRPGPGVRTRRLVIRTFEDDVALHGKIDDAAR